jgi:general secretion pathway protein I
MGKRREVDAKGFTLLELIVVLFVIAVAVGMVVPVVGRGTETLRGRSEVARFSAMLRHARDQAITTRRGHAVVIDPAAGAPPPPAAGADRPLRAERSVERRRVPAQRRTFPLSGDRRSPHRSGPRGAAGVTTRASREAGFTLLEVLVALAILSLAVVASIQGFAQGLRLLKLAGDHQQAMLLADQKLREVVEIKEGREDGTEGPLRWERTTRPLEGEELAVAGKAPRGRVFEIDVRVNWDAQRSIELRTLRTVLPAPATTGVPVPLGATPVPQAGGTTTSPSTPASGGTTLGGAPTRGGKK